MQDYIPRSIDINGKIAEIVVKQFDNNSRFLHIKLKDDDLTDVDNNAFDLTDCTAAIYIEPEGNTDPEQVNYVAGTIESAETGTLTFLLPGSVTQTVSVYNCEIWIYGGDEETHPIISSKPFKLIVEKSIRNDSAIEASQDFSALDAKIIEVENLKQQVNSAFVTPEMFGAKGDGVTDDTAALIDAIEDGRPVVGVGIYRITGTVFLTGGFRCNPGSMIRLDFDGDSGVVIGGDETDYDNTQYNFDVDIAVDCNGRTFSTAAVALNAVKRSHIKLRGVNCSGTFFRDVYGANGSNYENYIDINAIGTGAAGSVCALLHSSDNNYNQIISRDFETCVLLDTGSSQNINCVHGWLSSDAAGLWENSRLIAVAKNGNETVMPRLVFSFIYQDTMRYGFHLGENRIEAYGGFWFSAVNSGVIPSATRESYPVVSFYGEEVGAPSLIRADFHEFYSNPMTISDKRALIFNGTINPQRTGLNYACSDANAVPMGNTAVALQAGASNAPASAGESTLVQFNSLRQTVQMAVLADNSTHIRKKGTWDSSWGGWTEIYPGAPTSGVLTIPAQADENNPDIVIGSVNFCSKVNRVLEFSLVLTVNAAARNSVIAILPEGYRPLRNYQDVCFGLSGHQFLDIRTDGNIYFQCDAGEDIASTTVLRIHSVCVCG